MLCRLSFRSLAQQREIRTEEAIARRGQLLLWVRAGLCSCQDRSLRDLPPPELPKQPIPAEATLRDVRLSACQQLFHDAAATLQDRASHRSDSPRNRVRVKSLQPKSAQESFGVRVRGTAAIQACPNRSKPRSIELP